MNDAYSHSKIAHIILNACAHTLLGRPKDWKNFTSAVAYTSKKGSLHCEL